MPPAPPLSNRDNLDASATPCTTLWSHPVRAFLALLLASLPLSGCVTPAQAPPSIYQNPVLDADFPDPTVIRAPDGSYYGYATQSERSGKWINIQLARSADLTHWQQLGDALPVKP